MKTPITIPCQSCGEPINLEVVGSQLPERADCSACEASINLIAPLGNIPTMLIMERAKWELKNKDVTMSILLCAMAVEAQMSWLFFKWKALGGGLLLNGVTRVHREKWEAEWTEMRTVSKRSDELSRLLTGADFDQFAKENMAWLGPHLKGFDPATSVKTFFQRQIFEKRNQIVHYGNIDFEEADGSSCVSLAAALLGLLQAMDNVRFKKMQRG